MEQCFTGDRVLLDDDYLGPATIHVRENGVITSIIRSRVQPLPHVQVRGGRIGRVTDLSHPPVQRSGRLSLQGEDFTLRGIGSR